MLKMAKLEIHVWWTMLFGDVRAKGKRSEKEGAWISVEGLQSDIYGGKDVF